MQLLAGLSIKGTPVQPGAAKPAPPSFPPWRREGGSVLRLGQVALDEKNPGLSEALAC